MFRYSWLAIFIICPGILFQLGESTAAVLVALVFGFIELTWKPGFTKRE